jgi:hypothetical protein
MARRSLRNTREHLVEPISEPASVRCCRSQERISMLKKK